MRSVTAIITARGGSKGVPRKNIRQVNGKPLIAFTIDAALNCPLVDRCYVTTEDREIMEVSAEYGAEIIKRPPDLAEDESLSSDVVDHALRELAKDNIPEYFVLLQPTSPLRNAVHLEECLKGFFNSGSQCGVSVTPAEHHPWKMLIRDRERSRPLRDIQSLEMPRQQLPEALRINGAIYVMSTQLFLEKQTFFVEPAYLYTMDARSSIDIDTETDLKILEFTLVS
jgi:CMP-N-acetylneuraminic acid synthetase